jgi:CRP/FNR family cyclic AMP-dependent transcriptional regulator
MPERCDEYEGEEGWARLVTALGRQELLAGQTEAITAIAKLSEIWSYNPEEVIIDQHDGGDDLFFILKGTTKICANGREIRLRKARCHVGEIALLDPEGGRSADVIALNQCVLARIEGNDFRQLAGNPGNHLWHNLARTLGDRLREHTAAVCMPNDRPHIFLGSTKEAMPVMHALQRALVGDWAKLQPWDGDIFQASSTTIESLEQTFKQSDFAILVAGDEDWTISRGTRKASPRDNIILEIGLGMGAIGRSRTYIVTPRRPMGAVKWPSDLFGINMEVFDDGISCKATGLAGLFRGRRRYSALDEAMLDQMVADVADRLKRRMIKEGVI